MIQRLENRDASITWQALYELEDNGFLQDDSLYGWFLQHAQFEGANLSKLKANGLGCIAVTSRLRKIDVEQLVVMSDLRRTIMPDGKLYDGRYCLVGDLNWALTRYGIDVNKATPEQMAAYYDVSLEAYLDGQRWAKANLAQYGVNVPEYLQQLAFDDQPAAQTTT
ncbi:MAG: hypothetical protein IPK17_22565 [Chloroflexi bacterium]|uniref:hypothetical protein n=1 Tax=Candidatus Flexifilum breve TaxID=3140694 RepID=UPI0031367253|nr:hypothetical protein [Chloroflexota bacterium]